MRPACEKATSTILDRSLEADKAGTPILNARKIGQLGDKCRDRLSVVDSGPFQEPS